jgi:hypothetical protein
MARNKSAAKLDIQHVLGTPASKDVKGTDKLVTIFAFQIFSAKQPSPPSKERM